MYRSQEHATGFTPVALFLAREPSCLLPTYVSVC